MSYAPYRAKILFVQSLRGCDFLSQRRTNPYGDERRNDKNGKLPRKRQFTPVLHKKRYTRRSFIRSFCVCLDGGTAASQLELIIRETYCFIVIMDEHKHKPRATKSGKPYILSGNVICANGQEKLKCRIKPSNQCKIILAKKRSSDRRYKSVNVM